MKTNLRKLTLNDGHSTYGVFRGQLESEYFDGLDFRPDFVDFYFTIQGEWVKHDHKGMYVVKPCGELIEEVEEGYKRIYTSKKRGYHSRIAAKKKKIRDRAEAKRLFDDWLSESNERESYELPF